MSSDRDIDGQLSALEVPQAGILVIGGILEVLVQLLSDVVRSVDPRIGRVDVGRGLATGGTRDRRIQSRGPAYPRNGINDGVVGVAAIHATIVQAGIFGDELEIREVGLLEVLVSNVEDLLHVDDFADGENTTKRLVGSSILLEGADEQGPVEPSICLGKDSGDEGIS